MAVIGAVFNSVASGTFRFVSTAFNDVEATSDLLQLFTQATSLPEFQQVYSTVEPIAHAFQDITAFISARACIGRVHDLFWGRDINGTCVGITAPHIDWAYFSRKACFLLSDTWNTMRWLVSVHMLDERLLSMVGKLDIAGKTVQFNLLSCIGQGGFLMGSVLSIVDDVSQILRRRHVAVNTFDLGFRTATVAGFVLLNMVGGYALYASVALMTGSICSLAKFCFTEPGLI